MEIETPCTTNIDKEFTPAAHEEKGPRLALSEGGARILLQSWEQLAHGDVPRSIDAAACFFLPFLHARNGINTPHVALWDKDGKPDGILIARHSVGRPKLLLGSKQVPMPRLRTLDITYGGLEARSASTAGKQAAYLRQLLSGGDLDCISIHHLPEDNQIAQLLQPGLRWPGDGGPVSTGHWFSELTDLEGQPLSAYPAKARRNFRRKDRNLVNAFNGDVEVRELRHVDEVETLLTVAASICARSYQGRLGVGVRDNPRWRAICSILAATGALRGYLLDAGEATIAYAVGSVREGTCNLMATAFLPEYRSVAPGSYLVRRVIERLQQEKVRWLDFGFGEAPFKKLHGTMHRQEITLNLYSDSPAARTARVLDTAVKWADRTAHRLLQRSGLEDRARHLRRRIAERSSK